MKEELEFMEPKDGSGQVTSQYKFGKMSANFIKNLVRFINKMIIFFKNTNSEEHRIFMLPGDERICVD